MKLLIIFIIFNILNVIVQTIKSIATIHCNKWIASLVNAVAYGLYTYIVVLTVCELPLWIKVLVVALANLIGVFIVKLVEEKARKYKMWKVEVAIPNEYGTALHHDLGLDHPIPHNFNYLGKWCIFNCYCEKPQDTKRVVELAKQYEGKISAYESKSLGV